MDLDPWNIHGEPLQINFLESVQKTREGLL